LTRSRWRSAASVPARADPPFRLGRRYVSLAFGCAAGEPAADAIQHGGTLWVDCDDASHRGARAVRARTGDRGAHRHPLGNGRGWSSGTIGQCHAHPSFAPNPAVPTPQPCAVAASCTTAGLSGTPSALTAAPSVGRETGSHGGTATAADTPTRDHTRTPGHVLRRSPHRAHRPRPRRARSQAAGELSDLMEQAEELAGIRNDGAAIARAAVIDARLAVAREQQRDEPDK
jgi:hypothetical protein